MLRIPLSSDDAYLLLTPRGADLGAVGQMLLLSALLLGPAAIVVWLYRQQLRLVRGRHAFALLSLRLAELGVLWMLVALQPAWSHVTSEVVPSRIHVALDVSDSMDVVDSQRSPEESADLARVLGGTDAERAGWSRREIAQRLLTGTGTNLLEVLRSRHDVAVIGFADSHWLLAPAALEPLEAPRRGEAGAARGTDLRQALEASGGDGSAPLHGIILLTDGRHTRGNSPVERARQLGALGIPIYPVALGSKRPPPDLLIEALSAPDQVFKDAALPVAVRIKATHLPAQELTIELAVQDRTARPEDQRRVVHTGGTAVYDLKFEVPMAEAGTRVVTVRAKAAAGGEITLANNVRRHVVRVAEDQARVLLVDEEARWEYHYLAAALGRDPTVRLQCVLFTPPRLGLLKSEDDRGGLPALHLPAVTGGVDPLLEFDCIILGDVAPDHLPLADRARLERFVGERGGTLIVSAGKRSMPLAYARQALAADPLLKLLPIREPQVFERMDGFALQLTEEGKRAPFVRLDADAPTGMPELPKHFWAVVGQRQPGGAVLAVPERDRPDATLGLLVEQPYGLGQVVFVGLDSTWRWRHRTGDIYHHRFWGQLVRRAAADRLLPAGDRFVHFGTRAPVYRHGQPIRVAARLTESAPRGDAGPIEARIVRDRSEGRSEVVATVALRADPRYLRLLEAQLPDLAPGDYRVELHSPAFPIAPRGKAIAPFSVLPDEAGELLDLSTDWDLLQTLADESRGRLFTVADAEQIPDLLARKVQPREVRKDSRPWQDEPLVWWTLALLLGLLTLEWAWRKRLDLP